MFINLARDPAPFDEFIAPVRQLIEDLAIGDMHHYWWKEIAAPGNWKVAQEAFFESYHVPTTHPQLETAGADFIFGDQSGPAVDFSHHYHQYETFPHGHGRFFGGKKTPMAGHVTLPGDPVEMMAARLNLLVEGMDAMVLAEDVELVRSLKGKPIPEGSSLGGEYMKLLYSTAAAQNRPMPKPAPEVLDMWGGEIFVFPNLMILPQAGNAMRPIQPDQSVDVALVRMTFEVSTMIGTVHRAAASAIDRRYQPASVTSTQSNHPVAARAHRESDDHCSTACSIAVAIENGRTKHRTR